MHCFLVISTYGYYNPSKNYLNPLRKKWILLMSVTLKCWLALVLARLNTDSHSITSSVIRGKSVMMIQTALRTTATFSMHQNLQILSPSILRGSWEMRPFIVPFRIVIAAMEGAWCLSNVLITLVLFLFPKTVYWFLRNYFSFYLFSFC